MSQATEAEIPNSTTDVLTLSEAANFLRISDEEVIHLVTKQGLPGRKIGDQWRFLKQGLANWLLEPSARDRLLRHAGQMKDDPDLEDMLEKIFRNRGRKMIEDGE